MKQGYSRALRFVSMLLLVAMLMTSQAFTILAAEISEEISLPEEVVLVETETAETTDEDLQLEKAVNETAAEVQTVSESAIALASEEGSDTLGEIVSIEEPFRLQRNDREQITLNTGAVNYTETIVSLSGIGDNTFSLRINYDSSESLFSQHDYYLKYRPVYIVSYREYSVTYYSSGTKTEFDDWTHVDFYSKSGADTFLLQKLEYSKTETVPDSGSTSGVAQKVTKYQTDYTTRSEPYSYGNTTEELTYNEKRYGIGAGWSFNIPSIQGGNSPRLILPGIGAFSVSGNYLKKYPLKDMVLTPYSGYNNGQFDSQKKLTFSDGRIYYFDSNGLLLADVDRYGNTVTYKYTEIDGQYKPSEITDTAGRVISIEYADTESGRLITVTAPDEIKTELHIRNLTGEDWGEKDAVLDKIVYPDGESISFGYVRGEAKYSYSTDADQDIRYALLKKVAYDTGIEMCYSYSMADVDLAKGHLNVYRVAQRYTLDTTDYGKITDSAYYSYTSDYSRGSNYGTKVVETVGTSRKTNEYTFNREHYCTLHALYLGSTLKKKTVTEYDDYKLPNKVTTTVYSGSKSITTTEIYTNDKFGNTKKYYSPKSEGSTSNTDYRTTRAYSIDMGENLYNYIGYNLPLSVAYKQDANTDIKVENTLTEDKKSILSTFTYVNDALVAQTDYTYDGYGRVITEKTYPDVTAESGITKTYVYDGADLVSVTVGGITDANGNALPDITESYTYDIMGRPLTHTDANGNVTTTVYDVRGRVLSVTAPDGSVTEYDYDLTDNITTVSSSLREQMIYDFDRFGYQETVYYASGDLVSENFYDDRGRVIAEATTRDSSAASTAYYAYDAFDRATEKVIYGADNMMAYRETYAYNDAFDSSTSLVTKTVHGGTGAPNLVTKTYTNKYGEVVKEDAGGVVTQYEYDNVGNPIRVYYGDTTLASYTYDYAGNITSETNAAGDTRTVTYDAIGRKTAETDFSGNTTAYTYDNAGRLLTVTTPVSDTLNSVTKYYYDANGNVTKTEQTAQAEGEETKWRTVEQVYDNMNRVTDIITHVSESEKQYTHYEYNLAGDLTGVYTGMTVPFAVANADSYSHIAYTYDARGNNTSLTDALGQSESYEYDSLGMVVSATQRDGKVTRYTYNALGNIVSEKIYANADAKTPVSVKTTVYALTGVPLSVTIDGVKTKYTYNAQGSVLTETEGDVVKTYTYDSRGRKNGYTLTVCGEEKSSATYSYDSMDRLTSVTEGGKTTSYTYDANGNRASQTIDGVTTAYTYNKANLVTGMTNSIGELVISSFAYTYYADGNMHTKSETLLDTTTNTTYVYDGAGRLVSETTGDKVISYYYDANNNRTLMNSDGVITSYTYDKNNRLLTDGDIAYTYDANGNTLTAGNKTYTYNARGQQIEYTEYAEAVHIFADGVCADCGEAEAYMLGDADGNGVINLLDFAISMRYYTDMPEEIPPQDLNGDGEVDTEDYIVFARDLAGVGENYFPDLFAIDDLIAFADVNGDGLARKADYLIAYATLYEKEISECLTNGISLQTSMKVADINGDGEITEADKDIGIDYALNGNNTYNIGEMVDNTSPCDVRANIIIDAAQYAYNPSGLRSAKTVGGSTKYFVYNGMSIVYEYEDTISDGTIYYYGLNRTHNSSGAIYVYNAHGDTVQLVKNNAVVVSYTYDAFGNLTSQVGESDNPFLYCSEYFDSETQTYYLRARYYNPANGRFNAEDPHWDATNRIYCDDPFKIYEYEDALGLSKYTLLPNVLAIMQSGNLYVYCINNPVAFLDPTGMIAKWLSTTLKAIGAIAVVAGAVALTTVTFGSCAPLSVVVATAAIGTFAGATANVAVQYYANGKSFENISIDEIIIAGAQGGLSGVLSVTGIGVVGQAIGNALISASGSALNGDDLITTIDNAIVGALAGAAGGPGTGYGGLCFSSTLRNKRLMASFLKSLLRSSAVSNTATIVKQIKKAVEVLEQEGNATSK